MALSDRVIDPSAVLGVKVFCEASPTADLEVEPISAELEFRPGADGGLHIHPEQDESYHVLSGRLDLFMDGEWHHLRAGDSFSIPRGTVHGFRNSTDEVVRARNVHSPGLRFLEYLEAMERLIHAGKITSMTGFKSGIYLSLLLMKFRREIIVVRPPDWFIRLMARVGRFLGYRV